MALLIKGLIFIPLLACLFLPVYSNRGDCSIGLKFPFDHTNPLKFNETYIGVVEEFNTTNVKDASFKPTKYLKAILENGIIKISTTPEILNYDENENATGTIIDKLSISCDHADYGETIFATYSLGLIDINTHDPKFEKSEYVFEFYSPLKRNFDLHDAMKIIARDQDFSTRHLSFDMRISDDIYIQKNYNLYGKRHEVWATLRKDIPTGFEKSYNITVEDDGQPSRSSIGTLTLKVKEHPQKNSFEEPEYYAMINNMTLNFGTFITLHNGFDENTKIHIESDYAKYFKAEKNYLWNRIDITLQEEIPKPRVANPKIYITLKAIDNNAIITTDLIIESDQPIAYLCKFDQKDLREWKGPYKSSKSINDDHKGLVEEISTLNVLGLKCDSKYFQCVFENKILQISTNHNFEMFEENEVSTFVGIKIEVQCHYENYTVDYQHWITDINNHNPEFSAKSYNYIFYDQLPANMDLQEVFPLSVYDMDVTTLTFSLNIEEYNEISFWNGHARNKTAWPQLDLRNKISSSFKKKFVLRADDDGSPKQSGEAILYLEVRQGQDFRFTDSTYYAYIKDNTLVFPQNKIELINGFDNELDLFLRSDYWDHFSIKADMLRNEIKILTKSNVTSIPKNEVTLTIEARWKGLFASTEVYVNLLGEFITTYPSTSDSSETTTIPTPESSSPKPTKPIYPFVRFDNWIFYSTLSQIAVFVVAVTYFGIMIVIIKKTSFAMSFFNIPKKEIEVVKVQNPKHINSLSPIC